MERANAIQNLEPFENPKFYDELQFLKSESSKKPLNFAYIVSGFIKDCIVIVSVLGLLFSVAWWIPLSLLIKQYPSCPFDILV
jgi:ATP-binding cassette subfamily B protein